MTQEQNLKSVESLPISVKTYIVTIAEVKGDIYPDVSRGRNQFKTIPKTEHQKS